MRVRSKAGLSALLLALVATGARAEEGNFLSNLFKYGGTTVPPSQPKELEAPYCPPVGVSEGGAALQTLAGRSADKPNIRTQVTLGRLARECTRREDGSITVKVGVEGRVLLGPAGAPGRFDVPITIAIKSDEKVVTSRFRRLSATVAPGEAQGFFSVVEEDLSVPAAITRDYEIEVGLGGSAPKAGKAQPRRKAPVAAVPTSPEQTGASQ
ncbi:hypothetical protein [Methylobacterium durans]|uniref:Uncharacterized protein n=1 Tax=Methylobacterium durans TaxID=2202825 RepID=A0A2U8W749_9HYPH|nr:hypothetical protein [Methylobacterium durans]AWN41917.1 hypothetical protein DK389_17195 [Methylobacterium durans]